MDTNSILNLYNLPISLTMGFQLAQVPGAGTREAGRQERAGHPGQL